MRLFLALIVCFFTFSQCEEDIKDNERALISGTVVDDQGQALSGVEVYARTPDLVLGIGSTNASGAFEFISLVSTRNDFSIEVNPQFDFSDFSRLTINFLDQSESRSYEIGEIILNKRAELTLNIIKRSTDNNFLSYSIEYQIAECNIFDDPNVQINLDNCLETNFYNDATSINNPNPQILLNTVFNSIAVFTYRIGDGEPQTIEILLNQTNTIFDFEY